MALSDPAVCTHCGLSDIHDMISPPSLDVIFPKILGTTRDTQKDPLDPIDPCKIRCFYRLDPSCNVLCDEFIFKWGPIAWDMLDYIFGRAKGSKDSTLDRNPYIPPTLTATAKGHPFSDLLSEIITLADMLRAVHFCRYPGEIGSHIQGIVTLYNLNLQYDMWDDGFSVIETLLTHHKEGLI